MTELEEQRDTILQSIADAAALPVPNGLNEAQRESLLMIRQQLAMTRSTVHVSDRFVYRGGCDVLLRDGEVFGNIASRRELRQRRLRSGTPRMCYSNAARLALAHPGDLEYIEGYAYGGVISVPHAAVVDRAGRVWDPTWAWGEDNDAHDPADGIFLAVRVPWRLLEVFWLACGAADFLGDYYHQHPALRVPVSEWVERLVPMYQELLQTHCAQERPVGLATHP